MRLAYPAGLCLYLVVAAAPVVRATCDPTTDPDKTDIANARAAVAANCNCTAASSHGAYVSCATTQANNVLVNKGCAGFVKKCAARSTCGKRAGAVTCCVTKTTGTKCKIKRDAAHCTAPAGATACVGSYTSCCDACSTGGCATTTTTTTTSTTTTTTTTPQPCGGDPSPFCNGTCDSGMSCAFSQPPNACSCVPDALCQQDGQCFAGGDCLQSGCPPGYTCEIIDRQGDSICFAGQCGFGCFCPPGGACAVFQVCGDGFCNSPSEDCFFCPQDCGACPCGTLLTKWGSTGTGDGKFDRPDGVVVNPETGHALYVVDQDNNRIQEFNDTGFFLSQWGSFGVGDGEFQLPAGIAMDLSERIYVADSGNDRIQKFTTYPSTAFVTKWGSHGTGDGQFDVPTGVAVDAPLAGDYSVYVADSNNDRIQKFTSTGSFVTKWGTSGTGDGQFNNPHGVAVDAAGNIYVTDTYNHRIQKFTNSGGFLSKWGTSGTGDGQFQYPDGIAVDRSGDVFVADSGNYRIQKFTSAGVFVTKWGTSGSGDGQFSGPAGVSVDGGGHVYVTDSYNGTLPSNDRVEKFSCP